MINGSLVGPKLRVGDVVIFAENHEVPHEGKIIRDMRYVVEDCYNLDVNQTRITVRQLEANGAYNSRGERGLVFLVQIYSPRFMREITIFTSLAD